MKNISKIICLCTVLCLGIFLVLTACRSTQKAKIYGEITPVTDSTILEITRLDVNVEKVMDTIAISSNGKFSYSFTIKDQQPGFYYLYTDGRRVAQAIIKPGDAINLIADGSNITFKGSEDSQLLLEAAQQMNRAQAQFDSLQVLFQAAKAASDQVRSNELNLALGKVYVKQKQEALRFMFTHPKSFANVAVIYQRFSDELPLFADARDENYYKIVYDSLYTVYPKSRYVAAIKDAHQNLNRYNALQDALNNVQEQAGFPELCLPNEKAETVCLSSLKDKVIIVAFWHSQEAGMRLDNQDLLETYESLHSKGLEIYQIALDTDKTAWAQALKEQQIPWISLCDGYGTASSAVTLYNITAMPTFFVINKAGDIVLNTNKVLEATALVKTLCK